MSTKCYTPLMSWLMTHEFEWKLFLFLLFFYFNILKHRMLKIFLYNMKRSKKPNKLQNITWWHTSLLFWSIHESNNMTYLIEMLEMFRSILVVTMEMFKSIWTEAIFTLSNCWSLANRPRYATWHILDLSLKHTLIFGQLTTIHILLWFSFLIKLSTFKGKFL